MGRPSPRRRPRRRRRPSWRPAPRRRSSPSTRVPTRPSPRSRAWRPGSPRRSRRASSRSIPRRPRSTPTRPTPRRVSLATAPGRACYIPLSHRGGEDLFGGGLLPGQLSWEAVQTRLKRLLENPAVLKVGQNVKYDWLVLARHGIEVRPFDDTMLISYVLDAGKGSHGMDELARRHLGHQPITFADVAGTGRQKITFDKVALDKATAYAAEDADVTLRLWRLMKPRLAAERRASVYETLERPLVPVLARMEREGIKVDRQMLSRLSGDFAQSLARLEDEIQEMAGEKFSVSSPKQIGDILFGKMGLPGAKKTPSGQWATPATLLEELAGQGHELRRKILDWRQLSKLKSTYTDSLQEHADRATDRVHTSFALAATTTGGCPPRTPTCRTSRSARRRAGASARPSWPMRAQADLGRLQPDRIAAARPHRRHPAAAPGLRGGDRHPLGDRLGDVRRAPRPDDPGPAPPRQDDQFRHHLRHLGLRPRRPARHPAGRGLGLHQAVFRALPRHPGLYRRHQEDLPRQGLRDDVVRPGLPLSADPLQQPQERASVERQAINARSRARRPTSSAGRWRGWRGPCPRPASRPGCCSRSTTSWSSSRPTRKSSGRCRSSPG